MSHWFWRQCSTPMWFCPCAVQLMYEWCYTVCDWINVCHVTWMNSNSESPQIHHVRHVMYIFGHVIYVWSCDVCLVMWFMFDLWSVTLVMWPKCLIMWPNYLIMDIYVNYVSWMVWSCDMFLWSCYILIWLHKIWSCDCLIMWHVCLVLNLWTCNIICLITVWSWQCMIWSWYLGSVTLLYVCHVTHFDHVTCMFIHELLITPPHIVHPWIPQYTLSVVL